MNIFFSKDLDEAEMEKKMRQEADGKTVMDRINTLVEKNTSL